MAKVRVGSFQVLILLAALPYGKAIGFTAEVMARSVGNDAWLAMLGAFATGMAVVVPVVWLARRFGGQPPQRYLSRLLGRPLAALVLGMLALFFYGAFITSAITIELHINDYLMTETPLFVFVLLWTLLTMYGVYLGPEVAARLAIPGLFFFAALNLLMVLGSVDHVDLTRLLPLFDHGLPAVAAASLAADTDVGVAVAAALFLLPLTGRSGAWLRLSWWGLALGALLTVTWPIFEIGVLGPEVTAQYLIACMQLARAAELSIYVHRYELLMVIVFGWGMLTPCIITLHLACEVTAAALPWRVRRGALVLVCGLLTLVPHYYLAYDHDRYGLFLAHVWPRLAVPLAYGLPLLLCAVALLRPVPPVPAAGGADP